MPINTDAYLRLRDELQQLGVTLVAVSKTKPVADIQALYDLGQRDFGENYVQELVDKQAQLPPDIRWHFIGHLQTNKVKYLAPFVHLIHGVDSLKLLKEIDKQGARHGRKIAVLLQVHIAAEETKFGFDVAEVPAVLGQMDPAAYPNVNVSGLMGMASFSTDEDQVRKEFRNLNQLFRSARVANPLTILSMGMSNDYRWAVAEGSNLVRIGSMLFGSRQ